MAEDGRDKIIRRFTQIAPLLNGNLDAFERRRERARILEETGLSARQLRRQIQFYKERGYKSLEDVPRSDKGSLRAIPEAAIDEAVKLRQELPSRSVRRIIEILEGEKLIKPGEVSRTSLNRHLIQLSSANHARCWWTMGKYSYPNGSNWHARASGCGT